MPAWRSSGGSPGCTSTVPLVEPRSVTTALPWSAPAPGRISRWVEEISWWGLATVTRCGWSCEANRRASGARPTRIARSTSTTSPVERTSLATGRETTAGADLLAGDAGTHERLGAGRPDRGLAVVVVDARRARRGPRRRRRRRAARRWAWGRRRWGPRTSGVAARAGSGSLASRGRRPRSGYDVGATGSAGSAADRSARAPGSSRVGRCRRPRPGSATGRRDASTRCGDGASPKRRRPRPARRPR